MAREFEQDKMFNIFQKGSKIGGVTKQKERLHRGGGDEKSL